jgi:hypothetical protein
MPQSGVTTEPGRLNSLDPTLQRSHPSRVEILRLVQIDVQEVIGAGLPRINPLRRVGVDSFPGLESDLQETSEARSLLPQSPEVKSIAAVRRSKLR